VKQRLSIKHPPTQDKIIQEEKAFLNTQAITGEDQGVASLAFALYERRGREDGHDLDDWLEAERRIVSRREGRGF
jgi:DUF2934 family protein